MRTRRPAQPGGRATERAPRSSANELLYGRNAVREALRAGRRRFTRLMIAAGIEESERVRELRTLAERRGVRVDEVERQRLDERVRGHHQGVVLEASSFTYAAAPRLDALAADKAVMLALDGLEDPQNLGTLLRTAEATGVALVVIPTDRSAAVTPAVVNASAGAVEHLDVVQEVNLARWLGRAKEAGFWVTGLAGDGETQPLFDTDLRAPVVLVVGSEGHGMRRLVREACDAVVALPMLGNVESLNAAVAGSIALYEVLRDSGNTDAGNPLP